MARGRASTVRDLGDGTVLRVGGRPEREAPIMELARSHGFPVPRIHEVRTDALVLERIDGPTIAEHLSRHPWLMWRHVDALAALHERLHRILYDGARLVHFDLHPENVLISPAAGPVVIDWTNAHGGDPDADIAMTWLILETSGGLPGRLMARVFLGRVGRDAVRRGLDGARAFRLADPNVSDVERRRVHRATP